MAEVADPSSDSSLDSSLAAEVGLSGKFVQVVASSVLDKVPALAVVVVDSLEVLA